MPSLTYFIGLTAYYEIPIHFALAISGTCFTIQISKWINKSKFFTLFGRESLMIYALHGYLLLVTLTIMFRYVLVPENWLNVVILYLAGGGITVLLLLVCIRVKNWLKAKYNMLLERLIDKRSIG